MFKQVKNEWLKLCQTESIKNEFKELLKPVVSVIYNELYIYIWLICFYNVILILILIFILFYLKKQNYGFSQIQFNKLTSL
jgi:hypothetical protein